MYQIERQYIREAGSMDAISFFQYLVREGSRLSLIAPEQLESLQIQTVGLLAEQFNRWTGGQSSSVPVDTGQQIQQSVFYTVGYYLKSLPDAESAVSELKNRPLKELFQMGRERIERVSKEAEELLRAVQADHFVTDVIAYNDTIDGLAMFFTSYDADFEAHDSPASIDYPLGNDKMNLTGVEYIYEYLRKLRLENEFCSLFSREEIHSLLRGYDRQYKELLFNIYDLTLTNAVGYALLDRNDRRLHGLSLHLSDYDRRYLQKELSLLPAERLDALVDEAVSRLCNLLSVSDQGLIGYIKASCVNLKSRLKHALGVDGLHRLFLPVKDKDEPSAIRFEDKGAMEQGAFLKLADEIRECRHGSDKIALLRKSSPGMSDLTDLLDGECFFGDEYEEVYASLEDVRLALLLKKLPLEPVDMRFMEEENDREWKSILYSWLSQMEPSRKSAIFALAAVIADQD